MRLEVWLKKAEAKLIQAGIGSANLDALILAEDELGKDRSHLLAHPEIELSPTQLKKLDAKLGRRLKHEPLAYIRGISWFYGRRFKIDKRVLEPRPESETMVELLLELPKPRSLVDVGTGSGAIGITVKLELPHVEVWATEINKRSLVIAKQNAKDHKTKVNFLVGDLLAPITSPVDVVAANLPYVPDNWQINEAAAMEPRIAIFGGPDGLDLYRQLFKQLTEFNWKSKYVLTEALPPQHEELVKIAIEHGFKQINSRDFIQVFVKA